jgi:hypothetical protein
MRCCRCLRRQRRTRADANLRARLRGQLKAESPRARWPPAAGQTLLRALGIEITFSREGRAGNRVIRMRATPENTVSTVGSVSMSPGSGGPRPTGDFCDDNARPDLVGPPPVRHSRRC